MNNNSIGIIFLVIIILGILYYKLIWKPFQKLKEVRNQIKLEASIQTENIFYIINSFICGINFTLVYLVIVGELSIMIVAASNAMFIFIFNIIFRLAFNENLSYQSLILRVENKIFVWKLKKKNFDSIEYERLEKLVF